MEKVNISTSHCPYCKRPFQVGQVISLSTERQPFCNNDCAMLYLMINALKMKSINCSPAKIISIDSS
jgi:endogenous inhibitor of DNA gyrase (YacG/DUF329 family)